GLIAAKLALLFGAPRLFGLLLEIRLDGGVGHWRRARRALFACPPQYRRTPQPRFGVVRELRIAIDSNLDPDKNGGMLVLLLAMVVLFFLALGAIAFLVCVLIPKGRKYALSTALWFATWGPCGAAFLILALLGLAAGGLTLHATQMHFEDAHRGVSAGGRVSLFLGGA